MRYKQVNPAGATTYYVDKLMEIEFAGSAVDFRHYLGDVAILTKTGDLNDPTPGIKYFFRDRLGGVAAVGDDTGYLTETRGYDAYGKPRHGSWADKGTIGSSVTDRGFTDHEHLDDWELIHMNGRGFDYNLGRFLSIDPVIQAPGNSQSINPFAYIMNNPLSGTDPTGYCGTATRIKGGRGGGASPCKTVWFNPPKQEPQSVSMTTETDLGIRITTITPDDNGADVEIKILDKELNELGSEKGRLEVVDQTPPIPVSGGTEASESPNSGSDSDEPKTMAELILSFDKPYNSDIGSLGQDAASGLDLGDRDTFNQSMVRGALGANGNIQSYHEPMSELADQVVIESTALITGGYIVRGTAAGFVVVARAGKKAGQGVRYAYNWVQGTSKRRAVTRHIMEGLSDLHDFAHYLQTGRQLPVAPPRVVEEVIETSRDVSHLVR